MSTIRQQIVDAIDARLKLIAPGYEFALPGSVHRCTTQLKDFAGEKGVWQWRKVAFSKNQIPAIEFRDTDADTKPGPSTKHEHALQIELDIWFEGGTAIEKGRSALADVIAAIGSDPRWGGLARWTDIDNPNINMDQAGDVIAGVQLNFTVSYRTSLWRI